MYFILGMYLGVILVFVMKARSYIVSNKFSLKIWWQENKVRFPWCLIFSTLIFFVITFYPDSVNALEFVGFNMKVGLGETLSPILIGSVVANLAYTSKAKADEETK